MKKLLLSSLLFASAIGTAHAQTAPCIPTEDAPRFLAENYGEVAMGAGVHESLQAIITLWVNPETGSFTLTASDAVGQTCLVTGGYYWDVINGVAPPLGEEG